MMPLIEDWNWYCDLRDSWWYRNRLRPRPVTGFRFVRSPQSGRYVEDERGTDSPPADYFKDARAVA